MIDEPEIVKQLRYEEKTQQLKGSSKHVAVQNVTSLEKDTSMNLDEDHNNVFIPYKQLLDNANVLI